MDGPVDIRLSEMNITAHNAGNMQLSGKLTLPEMEISRGGVVGQILDAAGRNPGDGSRAVSAVADPLRVRIAGGQISYDSFNITFNRRQRVAFTGNIGLDGGVHLLASVPAAGDSTLGSSHTDIPISGTIDKPVVHFAP
jgi:hypothetical protein